MRINSQHMIRSLLQMTLSN